MREAFLYMFKDNCLWQKINSYLLLIVLIKILIAISSLELNNAARPELFTINLTMVFIINIILIPLMYTICCGYFCSIVSAIIKQKHNILLPKFNFTNNFTNGLKFCMTIISVIIVYFLFCNIVEIFTHQNDVSMLMLYLFSLLLAIFLIIFGFALFWNFANDNKISSFFNLKKIFRNISKAPTLYFKHTAIIYLVLIIGAILEQIVELLTSCIPSNFISIPLFSILSGCIILYIALTISYLIAKSIKTDSVV